LLACGLVKLPHRPTWPQVQHSRNVSNVPATGFGPTESKDPLPLQLHYGRVTRSPLHPSGLSAPGQVWEGTR
jgi:hypothetical protein